MCRIFKFIIKAILIVGMLFGVCLFLYAGFMASLLTVPFGDAADIEQKARVAFYAIWIFGGVLLVPYFTVMISFWKLVGLKKQGAYSMEKRASIFENCFIATFFEGVALSGTCAWMFLNGTNQIPLFQKLCLFAVIAFVVASIFAVAYLCARKKQSVQ